MTHVDSAACQNILQVSRHFHHAGLTLVFAGIRGWPHILDLKVAVLPSLQPMTSSRHSLLSGLSILFKNMQSMMVGGLQQALTKLDY